MGTLKIISNSDKPFTDRVEAGKLLSDALKNLCTQRAVVLGIPRGGVIVAAQLADALEAQLDIVLSHKLGAPGYPELAIGAVSEDGKLFLDETILSYVGAGDSYIQQEKAHQLEEIKRRVRQYRGILQKAPLKDRLVIITDDGVATGATMQAALWAARQEQPTKLIAALPVGPAETVRKLAKDADEMICLRVPPFFSAVGQFYLQFGQVEDRELLEILKQEHRRRTAED